MWRLRFDTLTAVMLIVVTGVSSMVHLYSVGYMSHDKSRARFMAYLSLFTFAMLMLVTADNLVQLFFGWEGVGVASYLLIGFWYKKDSAHTAAMKAFVVNRVGDFGFALGILAVYQIFGSIEFDVIFANSASAAGTDLNSLAPRCRRWKSPASCCSSARWASRPSLACIPGFPTRWRGRHPCPPLSMRRRWSQPVSS